MKKLAAAILTLCFLMTSACSSLHTGYIPGFDDPANPQPSSESTASPEENEKKRFYYVGDMVKTAFFDWTVTGARSVKEYNGSKADSYTQFVIVDMTVKNTLSDAIPMYEEDFQMQWDDGYDASIFPGAGTLYGRYNIEPGETADGTLVFAVPSDFDTFFLAYQEVYADGYRGDAYFVMINVSGGVSL